MAHARRKFFELHASNKSQIAGQALSYISALYDVEREVKPLFIDERLHIRQARSKPLADALYQWMVLQRGQITDGTATVKALDYRVKRWGALTRFADDGQLPIDNNWAENQVRPIATGRKNWLFAGSLRAGQRAAAVMSLTQSARLNGHDPYAYLKDVLQRLPTHKNHLIAELLPHRWQPLHARHTLRHLADLCQHVFAARLLLNGIPCERTLSFQAICSCNFKVLVHGRASGSAA